MRELALHLQPPARGNGDVTDRGNILVFPLLRVGFHEREQFYSRWTTEMKNKRFGLLKFRLQKLHRMHRFLSRYTRRVRSQTDSEFPLRKHKVSPEIGEICCGLWLEFLHGERVNRLRKLLRGFLVFLCRNYGIDRSETLECSESAIQESQGRSKVGRFSRFSDLT